MERPKILVLGAGLVGAEIARCLSEVSDVTVVDRNVKALALLMARASRDSVLEVTSEDFLDTNHMLKLARSHDVVVGAIEPSIAYRVLTQIAEAGTPIVDISFYEESPFSLNPVAERRGIPIVVDCGVAPGLSNMLLGREMANMRVEKFVCQCGGLPAKPKPPWYYKAPFSPRSVIDLYTRKAAFVADGKRMGVDPLETLIDVELSEYPGLGRLVGINTDGLRTLLDTTDVPNMVDQTLRYPEHMRLVKYFIESGLPFDESVLDAWKLDEDEDEFTVFVVRTEGTSQGKRTRVTYHALLRRDPVTHATSMSRMTGYPCAAVALLLAKGDITKAGVITLEEIGGDERLMHFVLDFMEERGVSLNKQGS